VTGGVWSRGGLAPQREELGVEERTPHRRTCGGCGHSEQGTRMRGQANSDGFLAGVAPTSSTSPWVCKGYPPTYLPRGTSTSRPPRCTAQRIPEGMRSAQRGRPRCVTPPGDPLTSIWHGGQEHESLGVESRLRCCPRVGTVGWVWVMGLGWGRRGTNLTCQGW
jgi:hypothetical protein